MDPYIRASVSTVATLFGQDRVIQLPWFQRAYAWRENHVLRLVTDILAAMDANKVGYSLGHIHLAATVGARTAALVDGHQRAITLAMVFAILRDLTASDPDLPTAERMAEEARLHAHIIISGDTILDDVATNSGSPSWRLSTQPQMADFFERYVQQPGATLQEPDDEIGRLPHDLTLAERNLIETRNRLRAILGPAALSRERRTRFAAYLLTRCYFVVIEVDDEDDAWSMLGVEQATRLPHDPSEQSKVTLIYAMPPDEQEAASAIWQAVQSKLGNERMSELLSHLRTVRLDRRSTKPLEGDLQQLYGLNRNGLDFMTTVLRWHADAMSLLDGRQIGSGVLAKIIAGHLDTLNWLDHRLWVAPALAWLITKTDQHPETEQFFAQLDGLAWMLRLSGTDPTEQETRFIKLAAAVAREKPVAEWPEFAISEKTCTEALAILRSRTFYHKHTCNRVMRRLCYQMGADPGVIEGVNVSIEHILPRKPPKHCQWLADFGSLAGVSEYADRLGNLALLTGPQNRRAAGRDWSVKSGILQASGFALSLEAAAHGAWTPKTIEQRSERLIAQLFATWGLTITPS